MAPKVLHDENEHGKAHFLANAVMQLVDALGTGRMSAPPATIALAVEIVASVYRRLMRDDGVSVEDSKAVQQKGVECGREIYDVIARTRNLERAAAAAKAEAMKPKPVPTKPVTPTMERDAERLADAALSRILGELREAP